jgi:hypothetical protein
MLLPAHAGSSLADFSTLKMEAIRSSETSVHFTGSTRRHIREDGILHSPRCENLKSYNLKYNNFTCALLGKVPFYTEYAARLQFLKIILYRIRWTTVYTRLGREGFKPILRQPTSVRAVTNSVLQFYVYEIPKSRRFIARIPLHKHSLHHKKNVFWRSQKWRGSRNPQTSHLSSHHEQ